MGQWAICDYEGSDYPTAFWGEERTYEDRVERAALRALLPRGGRRLLEIGAGFGRLADLYTGYQQVVLLDYSRSMLRQAQERWGHDPRFRFVVGDLYHLPFVPGLFDVVTMVRVIHHVQAVPAALEQVQAVLTPGGRFILEFANKRHLKAIGRWLLRRQSWNPFLPEPYEFVPLNYDFHPRWMADRLREAGLTIEARRTVSHFRLPFLKRRVPLPLLVAMDRLVQPTGRWWQLSPSVFLRCRASWEKPLAPTGAFFRCPACGETALREEPDALFCPGCGHRWPRRDGIYDFKQA